MTNEQADENRPGADQTPATPARVPPDQLEQFRQFQRQQFEDYLRFTSGGNPPNPGPLQHYGQASGPPAQVGNPAAPSATPASTPLLPSGQPRPGIRAPRWLKRLGGKVLSGFLLLIVLIIAGTLAINHFFGGSDEELPAPEAGKGTYTFAELLQPNPYRAVQLVYQQIAQGLPDLACGVMSAETQQQFATNLGFADCNQAVIQLSGMVTNKTAYAQSIPFAESGMPSDGVVTVSSCAYTIEAGPPLGAFTVARQTVDKSGGQVKGSQWLIVGHKNEPTPCLNPPPAPLNQEVGPG